MSMQFYEFGGSGLNASLNSPILSPRSPVNGFDTITPNGDPYNLLQAWQNTTTLEVFQYLGEGIWVPVGPSSGPVESLTGNTGGPVLPSFGNINVLGSGVISTSGSGDTLTITSTAGGFPITPYVVGPIGQAGYQTIQSAINAAHAAGGGLVYVQEGTYTENLTLYNNVPIQGAVDFTTIIGVHVPPASGSFTFDSLILESATHIFSSAVAGTASLNINNCFIIITNGYVFNLVNWTGELLMDNCGEASTEDGVVNNTAGAPIKFINVEIGAGSSNVMTLTGNANVRFDTCNINCPTNITGSGQFIFQNGVEIKNSITIGGSKTGAMVQTDIITGASTALTWSSSGTGYLSGVTINSTAVPVIAGAGTGVLTLGSISFVSNSGIANTLTLAGAGAFIAANLTDNGFILGGGALPLTATAAPTNGQLPIGHTGNPPTIATLTAGSGIVIANGAGSITISANGEGLSWTDVTGVSQTAAPNNGYTTNNSSLVTVTLPAVISYGAIIRVVGKGTGGWTIAQNAGQSIHIGTSTTTVGASGSLSSTAQFDGVELLCSVANTTFTALSWVGNLTVV
jgi:hypothetical protein